MKYFILLSLFVASPVRADLWGNDLPLLLQIVINTLGTLNQLSNQTGLLSDELRGINDRIYRIKTISDMVQPSQWEQWKDPREALNRLQKIYYTLPKEYRTEKSDEIEVEIAKAMNLISQLTPETKTTFLSGKELEQRGADSSPGVAQKLTASGVGTLISMEAQSQALESQITSLLAQVVAKGAEKESRGLVALGTGYMGVSTSLTHEKRKFSDVVLGLGREK